MKQGMKENSQLWKTITSTFFAKVDNDFLHSFRKPGGGANSRLAAWDPLDKSMRYYKFFLFNVARRKDQKFFEAYRRLGNTQIGNPMTVTVSGCQVDIDYLFALEEYFFLAEHLNMKKLNRVVEIGAGFGRTCHVLLHLVETIQEYVIVDLPEVLELSKIYLKKVIPEHFGQITFISSADVNLWTGLSSDLVINIDSFQEMPPEVIDRYMDKLIACSAAFYCKNPVGKYKPECVGLSGISSEQLLDVYSLGYSRQIFDLFNDAELAPAVERYLAAYRPKNMNVAAHMPLEMFPYLEHALYVRHGASLKGEGQ